MTGSVHRRASAVGRVAVVAIMVAAGCGGGGGSGGPGTDVAGVTLSTTPSATSTPAATPPVDPTPTASKEVTPTRVSSGLALEPRESGSRLWSVNPDGDTVAALDAGDGRVIAEVQVGRAPRAVAVATDGRIWVAVQGEPALVGVDPATLRVAARVPLPAGSQPFGLVGGDRGALWVALQGTGEVLRVDADGRIGARVDVGPDPRHLSLTPDGARLLVSRFITRPLPGEASASPGATDADGGELVVVDTAAARVERTVVLRLSDRIDTSESGRGVPNYLGAAAVSPDGRMAWVPSKQDNVLRGRLRDGLDLDFQSTVRAVSSRVDLPSLTEDTGRRIDHDNAGLASAAAWHPSGRWLFVALETSRQVAIVDPSRGRERMRLETGLAPQALAVSADGLRLYVQNYMSRSVSAFDLGSLAAAADAPMRAAWSATTQAVEPLDPRVLRGKQLFHDARDRRLARDAYVSCASCHADAGHDGRVWDFTGLGEGLRNTPSLRGRGGAPGRLHWSANFDEAQDFEGQIRELAGGTGLMRDDDLAVGTRAQPLGDPKAGLAADLDALAAYLASLTRFDPSPRRAADGTLTALAATGRALFDARGCAGCHGGPDFVRDPGGRLISIGTVRPSSGGRLGGPLPGIAVPALRDAWATAPYLHDGSAPTLAAAIRAHQGVSVGDSEIDALARYVLEMGADPQGATR